MKINKFDFKLPADKIARFPANKRGHSKLMVIDRKTGNISHHIFEEILEVLPEDSFLVINRSKVIPAKLFGLINKKVIELLIIKNISDNIIQVFGLPAKKLKIGTEINFENNIKAKVDKWLERLDLTDWANKKVETLSKGMSQKVQFISTVVAQPELVILDEPFTGLDPVNTEVIKDAILEIQDQGTTVIFSTHDMSMAEKMCDFIFMIYKGKKVLDGTLTSIQDEYGSDTIRVRTGNGADYLKDLPGVEKVNDYGQIQELRVAQNADPQLICKEILERTRIQSFDIVKPSLHDIFVRIAGSEAKEVENA